MRDHYDYLVVGGGMAADAAAKGIREQLEGSGREPTIGILSEEPTAPFPRPALSKKLWTDPDFTREDAALDTADETGADVVLEVHVDQVVPEEKVVVVDGQRVAYGRLLLATGGRPRRIEGLDDGERVLSFRSLADYERLRALSAEHPSVVVVGGGFIGTEIAAALVQHDCPVTLVHPGGTLAEGLFPADLATRFESWFDEAGVTVRGGAEVVRGEVAGGDRVVLTLDDGSTLDADVVVVGLGIEPASALARDAGLALADDGGIVVDERLETTAPDVYAAGDVASYPDRILGRTRVEHVDNATTMGTTAGRVLAGSEETYAHTPYFYSAVFGHRYEALGTLDSGLRTVVDVLADRADGEQDGEPVAERVVYYVDDAADGAGTVRGVLLWDVGDDADAVAAARDAARAVLARGGRPADDELVGAVG